jgi:Rv0078B-related antitoxin
VTWRPESALTPQICDSAPRTDKITAVDKLAANDRELDRLLGPAEKLAQALEMMSVGIRLKRVTLRQRSPELDEAEIDRLLMAWLTRND